MFVTDILSRVYALSRDDDPIGGWWAVIATVFVICLAYLAFQPFCVRALALLIGHAWQQPILRFADPVAGVAVGVAAAWLGLRLTGQRLVANQ